MGRIDDLRVMKIELEEEISMQPDGEAHLRLVLRLDEVNDELKDIEKEPTP